MRRDAKKGRHLRSRRRETGVCLRGGRPITKDYQDHVRGTPSDWVREMPLFCTFLGERGAAGNRKAVCAVNFSLKQCVRLACQNTNKGSRKDSGVRKEAPSDNIKE